MNKPLLGGAVVVLALAGAYAGGTLWSGHQVKVSYDEAFTRIEQQLPIIRIADRQFDKSLLGGTYTYTVKLACVPAGLPQAPGITLRDHIKFGPLPGFKTFAAATIDSELVLPADVQQALTKVFGDQAPYTLHTVVGYGGAVDSSLRIAPAKWTQEGEGAIDWKGLDLHAIALADGSVRYELTAPGLVIDMQDAHSPGRISMEGMAFRGDAAAGAPGSWLRSGKGSGEIAGMSFQFADGSGKDFKGTISGLTISSETTLANELLSSRSRLQGVGQFGDTKVDRITMDASMERIHAPTYEKIVKDLLAQAATCDGGQAADPRAAVAAMQAQMLQLLPYDPQYGLDKFEIDMGGKKAELSYRVGTKGVTKEDLAMPLQALFMTKGEVTASAKLPVSWIDQALGAVSGGEHSSAPPPEFVHQMIDQIVAQGFVTRDGDVLSAQFSMSKGVMTINGKPLPMGGSH